MRTGLKGFALGSFVLVVLYVAVQPNSPKAVAAGGNWLISGWRRLLSPDVAGIPQRKGAAVALVAPGAAVGAGVGSAIGGTGVGGPPGATLGSLVGHAVGG